MNRLFNVVRTAHQCAQETAGVLGGWGRSQDVVRNRTRHLFFRTRVLLLVVVGHLQLMLLLMMLLRLLVLVGIVLLLVRLVLLMVALQIRVLAGLLGRGLTGTAELEEVQQIVAARTIGSLAAGGSRSGRRVLHDCREKRLRTLKGINQSRRAEGKEGRRKGKGGD